MKNPAWLGVVQTSWSTQIFSGKTSMEVAMLAAQEKRRVLQSYPHATITIILCMVVERIEMKN